MKYYNPPNNAKIKKNSIQDIISNDEIPESFREEIINANNMISSILTNKDELEEIIKFLKIVYIKLVENFIWVKMDLMLI